MTNQIPELNIGDKIGFTILAKEVDENDKVLFFPVVEVTTRDGERAYRYEFPDGSVSSAAIRQSDLIGHPVQIEARVSPKMVCISNRTDEFRAALERGKNNRFDVYADWEKDAFVVVNLDNKNEYHVTLDNSRGAFYAECECPDFIFRRKENKRICKHIAEVLVFALMQPAV